LDLLRVSASISLRTLQSSFHKMTQSSRFCFVHRFLLIAHLGCYAVAYMAPVLMETTWRRRHTTFMSSDDKDWMASLRVDYWPTEEASRAKKRTYWSKTPSAHVACSNTA